MVGPVRYYLEVRVGLPEENYRIKSIYFLPAAGIVLYHSSKKALLGLTITITIQNNKVDKISSYFFFPNCVNIDICKLKFISNNANYKKHFKK